jgi:integrase
MSNLSESYLRSLTWSGSDKRISDGEGLYINLREHSKTWIVRKKKANKTQIITIGKWPALSCKQARKDARKFTDELDISAITVTELANEFLTDVVFPESKVVKQVEGYINNIKDEIGCLKVIAVKRAQLTGYIKRYSSERGARSADRMRSYLKQLFSYGVELGYVTGESPMDGVTKRVTGYKAIDRSRVLTMNEIRMVWSWKNEDQGWQKTEDNVRVIKFLLLTGLRISEAQAGYIDDDKFRMDDTKGKHSKHEKRPHWVYLTDTAKSLLPLPKCTATNIQAWLRRKLINEAIDDRFTPHDCRRTFATIANDNGIQPFIVERALNHRMQGVMSIYNHAEYESDRTECANVVESVVLSIVGKKTR